MEVQEVQNLEVEVVNGTGKERDSFRAIRDLRESKEFSLEDYSDGYLFVLEKPTVQCADVETLLGEYVENSLPPTLRARIDAHVADCGECRVLKASYEKTIELARGLADRPVPSGVSERLRHALNAKLGIQLPVG